ncbi:MAG TPA: single-stranded DNA-binding protein [Nocardioidaceae bacterium]|nr:single-stranded DNA-binding protein [Nocardioidaceae bacterium]
MSDTYVTFQGWVGNDVTHKRVNNISVANFRVATTPRLKRKGEWVDGDTTWYSVAAWRLLADHVTDSVKKGDAVIVHGKLRSEAWRREDGQVSTTLVVDASFVGHDMCKGTSTFTRSSRPDRVESDIHDEVAEMIHQEADVETKMSSWGEPVPQPPFFGQEPGDEPAA